MEGPTHVDEDDAETMKPSCFLSQNDENGDDEQRCQHEDLTSDNILNKNNQCKSPLEHPPTGRDLTIGLYGRDREQALLRSAFRRRLQQVSDDILPELVLVTGLSGSGKTALITSILQEEAEAHGGYFLCGKFDVLERTKAYYPFVRAFAEFVQAVLDGSDDDLKRIRQSLKSITAAQPLLVDMVPALHALFEGPATSNECEIKAGGAQRRLQFAFGQFLRALCSPTQPICLFLDDLQWAQPASIDLVAFLVEENIQGLLVVGACRGQEVSLKHHLSVSLRELEANKVEIQAIVLESLHGTAVAEMIYDMLSTPGNAQSRIRLSSALADLVLKKTGGNTLLVVELIKTLSDEGLLAIAKDQESVVSRVKERLSGSLDLIEDKIQSMPNHVQQVLMLASCLGAEFDEILLRKLISFEIHEALVVASDRGVIRQDHTNRLWRFTHDQIQQATYSLIPADEKEMAHLTIGRTLLSSLSEQELDLHFFLIVNQLSFGIRLVTDKGERSQFASLLVLAGQKAAQSFTFLSASTYLELGISLLEDRRWRDQYELSMELYHAAAESEYCNGHYKRTDELVDEILINARSDTEKIEALTISIYSLGARNEMQKAVDLGIKVLRNLAGHRIPAKASLLSVAFDLMKTKRLLKKYSNDDILYGIPAMTDDRDLAAMRIMSILFAYAIHFRPMVGAILAMRIVQNSIQRGCSGMSAVGFCSFAMVLCNGFGEIKLGIRLARLSLRLLDKFQSREWLPRVYSATYGLCFTYCDPMRDCLKPLLMAHRVGLVSGDIEFSSIAAAMYAGVGINSSVPLSQFVDECSAFLQMMKQHNQTNALQFIIPTLQFTKCMMGADCSNPSVLSGDIMDITEALRDATSTNNQTIVAFIQWTQLVLAGYFCDYDTVVLLSAKLADNDGTANFGCYNRVNWYLHEAIACFSLKTVSYRRTMKVARRNLKRLKTLASFSEHNFVVHVCLLEAEILAAKGKSQQAVAKYEDAISRANDEKLWQLAGLAHERAAQTMLQDGRTAEAKSHVERAIDSYDKWGAIAKVDTLKKMAFVPESHPTSSRSLVSGTCDA